MNNTIDTWVKERLSAGAKRTGFGYWGNKPLGESWGMVFGYAHANNSLLEESNFRVMVKWVSEKFEEDSDFEAVEFGGAFGTIEHLIIRLTNQDGSISRIAHYVYGLLQKLEDYPVLDESDWSEREWESDYLGNMESIRSVIRDHQIDPHFDYGQDSCSPRPLEVIVRDWLNENDPDSIDHASTGYSDGGGYIESIPVLGALYALGALWRGTYTDKEWADIEDVLEAYVMIEVSHAFMFWKSKL